jgi:hypothetical protein
VSGASEEPRNLVERAAAAAMDAVDRVLAEAGATTGTLYIALHANGMPAGELDAVTAAHGADLDSDLRARSRDVIAFLVAEAAGVGSAIGVDVKIVPLRGGPDS